MVEFKTPSGYTVKLRRDYLTYGEKMKLQEIYLKNTKVDPNKASVTEFNPSVIFEAQKVAFNIFLSEITTPDSKTMTENLYQFVMDMPERDGQAIFDKINVITNPTSPKEMEKKID